MPHMCVSRGISRIELESLATVMQRLLKVVGGQVLRMEATSQVELISLAAQGWAFAEPFDFLPCQLQPQASRNFFGDFLLHIKDISQLAAVACTP